MSVCRYYYSVFCDTYFTLRTGVLDSLVHLRPRLAVLENVYGLVKHLKAVKKIMRRKVGVNYHIVLAPCPQVLRSDTDKLSSHSVKVQFCSTDVGAVVRRPRLFFLFLDRSKCTANSKAELAESCKKSFQNFVKVGLKHKSSVTKLLARSRRRSSLARSKIKIVFACCSGLWSLAD